MQKVRGLGEIPGKDLGMSEKGPYDGQCVPDPGSLKNAPITGTRASLKTVHMMGNVTQTGAVYIAPKQNPEANDQRKPT